MGDFEADLARHVSSADANAVSAEVIGAAQDAVLDTLGVALRGSSDRLARVLAETVAADGGTAIAQPWGLGMNRVPATSAALANATFAHVLELDDRMPAWSMHPGCVVIPSAFAAVEAASGTGADLLSAVLAGYDAAAIVGRSVKLRPGTHESAHKGTWAAAAAAARGLGLSADQVRDALGIAATMASSTGAYGTDPRAAGLKGLHAGFGARNGVQAALLARAGVAGPADSLTGHRGYAAAYGDGTRTPSVELDRPAVLDREVKPYAAWGGGHLVIDALNELRTEALERGAPTRILVEGSERLIANHESAAPGSVEAARFSIPILAAIALLDGAQALSDPSVWREDILERADVRRVASVVECRQEASASGAGYGDVTVTIEFDDAAQLAATVTASRGTLARPLSDEEQRARFRFLASPVLGPTATDGVASFVATLLAQDSLVPLSELLKGTEQ